MKRPKLKIITGYCPIPGHPRSAEEYGKLGEYMFSKLNAPVKSFYTQLDACWLGREVSAQPFKVKHYEGDNPDKNTLEYHIVQHQKVEWLYAGMLTDDTSADTYIWMDYGIAHQPGVTTEIVNEFLPKVARGDLAIPGCWTNTDDPIEMSVINWRFCGSLLIVPREHVMKLYHEMQNAIRGMMKRTHYITWEVNTLARVERLKRVPIRWYSADHNETQFTNYEAPDAD